ncbi:uncharacterized protein C05D11.1 isoform X1 [Nematostella vectensis]|uniref:uncharacterized protein C05D11.1 isoform X1 n=1 Tax=Nematostella vectensis TaxID=45351 RepID=UPI0020778879|nr:uncharacterized protein C05D11.1 isoform X1 [Nematostella vectensis]
MGSLCGSVVVFNMADNFELLTSFEVLGDIPVKKYRSKRTGIQFCFAQVRGPLVNGFLCLATEAHDDDGLPHTLEHLVFMGSEQYPYKGLLDLLANRCLAQGTNAWTATDHTCYTIETAGSEGFINLLPIYLDHVLYPTLTESAYITEVQHINGEGEDAGVVYCEMQARENSGNSRTHLALLRNLYPGHCGFKSETGGIMENLRTSCSHKKVCDYHHQFYRPDNLCVVITGQVDPEKVFEALTPFEDRILVKSIDLVLQGQLPPHVRPWQDPVPPLPVTTDVTIPFPTEDESSGMVLLGCRGPPSSDRRHMAAMQIMLDYLTDSSISPLQKNLVEIADPFCSDVGYQVIEHSECCVYIKAMDVPSDKLSGARQKIIEVISSIADGSEALDMTRMATVIHRVILDTKDKIENDPHDTFADLVIYDFLYSHSSKELEKRADFIHELTSLQSEGEQYWKEFLKSYFVKAPLVMVIGEPSKQLMEDMAAAEKARVAAQREALGETGLKEKAERLKKASQENEVAPPPEVVARIAIPSTSSILFHPLTMISNRRPGSFADPPFPVTDIPYAFQFDNVSTMFVKLTALLDTSGLSEELKPYLSLYLEVIFESPVLRDGVLVPHEVVVAQLASDTLAQSASVGVSGGRFSAGDFDQLASVSLKMEAEKYTKGVRWLHEILYKTQMSKERLDIVAKKMINEVTSMKRNGRIVTRDLLRSIVFSKKSNHFSTNMVRQHLFLTKLTEQLASKPDEVISKMEAVRNMLTNPANLRIHVTADVTKIPTNPHTVWKESFLPEQSAVIPKSLPEVSPPSAFLDRPLTHGKIVGLGSVESSYLIQAASGISTFDHPDLASLMVYLECLITLEGPIWRQVRGLGLSYHYSMRVEPSSGLLYFILARSTHLVKAYLKTKEIVDGYLSGETLISAGELEAAISSVIFSIINREKSVSSVASESMLGEFRGVQPGYNRDLLNKVSQVTMSDLERVGQRYLAPLFDPVTSWCAVCCNPSKVDEIKQGLKSLNKELIVVPSLEEEFTWA